MVRRMVSGGFSSSSWGTWGWSAAMSVSTAMPAAMGSPWHSSDEALERGELLAGPVDAFGPGLELRVLVLRGERLEIPGVQLVEDLVLELR